jgi:hypothetical protein
MCAIFLFVPFPLGRGIEEGNMSIDELKLKVRKLNTKCGQLKMKLHDLSEDLPNDWQTIMEVARETHEGFAELAAAKKALAAAEADASA